ncbi:MAG: ATP-binding cassette domain-containing protein [Candidatus Cloacimonetes bacterium]|nr:ATP-binding cassette domain-containing protein [Candidatus Cloacimonadota bacterium]HOA29046.1 ATP-binding cassette domain-containing protein [Candidatus Cloacimonadota bacterium]HOH60350.1 ATP-binding cassette domain-containing protein [Candidatus Cloacimonadota bacterium]HPI25012.1 ATP-binding cassette domain-containing protein [Candidatus Cloacimonadota bacterium]
MIEIKDLCRNFGEIRAVDKISFSVSSGNITGFLGPNGAGKTTTLRMMVGYLQPGSGSILIDDQSIFENPIQASAKIGYLPEHNPLYEDMIVVEALEYVARLRKMTHQQFRERKLFVIESCGLKEVQYQKIGTLSKGYRQRVGLAQAILHDPEILILDEPTSGLDPNQIIEIRQLIRALGKEKTVILSSHILQEVQALCDRVLIINKGKIIVDDSISNLDAYLAEYHLLHLELEGANIDIHEFVDYYPELQLLEEIHEGDHCRMKLRVASNLDVKHDLARYVAENGWLILTLHTERKSLEEIFHKLTLEPDQSPTLVLPADRGIADTEQIEDVPGIAAICDNEAQTDDTAEEERQ